MSLMVARWELRGLLYNCNTPFTDMANIVPLTDVHAVLVEMVMAAGAYQEVFSFIQFVQADGTDIFRLLSITLVTVNINWGLIGNSQLCEGCGGCMCRCEGGRIEECGG